MYGQCPPPLGACESSSARVQRLAVRPAALLASAVLFVLVAPVAHAWSPPSAIYVNGDSKAYAVAGDPSGNAFAVVGGGTPDQPLSLVERDLTSGERSAGLARLGRARAAAPAARAVDRLRPGVGAAPPPRPATAPG